MEQEIERLLENITNQAKHFLAEAGEFYPFGSVIKPDGKLVPLGVYLENDHPDSNQVLQILEQSIKTRLARKEAIAAGIGLDVLYKPIGKAEKVDAVKMMMLTEKGEAIDYYLPYKKEEGKFIFDKIVSETGTLKLA